MSAAVAVQAATSPRSAHFSRQPSWRKTAATEAEPSPINPNASSTASAVAPSNAAASPSSSSGISAPAFDVGAFNRKLRELGLSENLMIEQKEEENNSPSARRTQRIEETFTPIQLHRKLPNSKTNKKSLVASKSSGTGASINNKSKPQGNLNGTSTISMPANLRPQIDGRDIYDSFGVASTSSEDGQTESDSDSDDAGDDYGSHNPDDGGEPSLGKGWDALDMYGRSTVGDRFQKRREKRRKERVAHQRAPRALENKHDPASHATTSSASLKKNTSNGKSKSKANSTRRKHVEQNPVFPVSQAVVNPSERSFWLYSQNLSRPASVLNYDSNAANGARNYPLGSINSPFIATYSTTLGRDLATPGPGAYDIFSEFSTDSLSQQAVATAAAASSLAKKNNHPQSDQKKMAHMYGERMQALQELNTEILFARRNNLKPYSNYSKGGIVNTTGMSGFSVVVAPNSSNAAHQAHLSVSQHTEPPAPPPTSAAVSKRTHSRSPPSKSSHHPHHDPSPSSSYYPPQAAAATVGRSPVRSTQQQHKKKKTDERSKSPVHPPSLLKEPSSESKAAAALPPLSVSIPGEADTKHAATTLLLSPSSVVTSMSIDELPPMSPTSSFGFTPGSPMSMNAKERRAREMKLKESVIGIISERLFNKAASTIAPPKLVAVGAAKKEGGDANEDAEEEEEDDPILAPSNDVLGRTASRAAGARLAKLAAAANRTSTTNNHPDASVGVSQRKKNNDDIDPFSPVTSAQAQIQQAQIELAVHSTTAKALAKGTLAPTGGADGFGVNNGALMGSMALARLLKPTGPSPFEKSILERWCDEVPSKQNKGKKSGGNKDPQPPPTNTDHNSSETQESGVQQHHSGSSHNHEQGHHKKEGSVSAAPRATYASPHSQTIPLRHELPSLLVKPFQPLLVGDDHHRNFQHNQNSVIVPVPTSTAAGGASVHQALDDAMQRAAAQSSYHAAHAHLSSNNAFAPASPSFSQLILEMEALNEEAQAAAVKAHRKGNRRRAAGLAVPPVAPGVGAQQAFFNFHQPSLTQAQQPRGAKEMYHSFAELFRFTPRMGHHPSHGDGPANQYYNQHHKQQRLHNRVTHDTSDGDRQDSCVLHLLDEEQKSAVLQGGSHARTDSESLALLPPALQEFSDYFLHLQPTLAANKSAIEKHMAALRAEGVFLPQSAFAASPRSGVHIRGISASNSPLLGSLSARPSTSSGPSSSLASSPLHHPPHHFSAPRRPATSHQATGPISPRAANGFKGLRSTHTRAKTSSSTGDALPSSSSVSSDEHQQPSLLQSALDFDPALLPNSSLIALLHAGGGVELPDRIKRNLYSRYAKELPDRVEELRAYYLQQAEKGAKKKQQAHKVPTQKTVF